MSECTQSVLLYSSMQSDEYKGQRLIILQGPYSYFLLSSLVRFIRGRECCVGSTGLWHPLTLPLTIGPIAIVSIVVSV